MTQEERMVIIVHNAIFQEVVNSSLISFTASNYSNNMGVQGFNLTSKPTEMEGI